MTNINRILQPILSEGIFFRRENHAEFTKAYNDLFDLETDIKTLDERLGPEAEYGQRYAFAKQDMSSLPVKRRKLQMVLDDASGELGQIITRARDAMNLLIAMLAGIVRREPGSKYDSLSNLDDLEAKVPDFMNGLIWVIQKLHDTLDLLANIDAIESAGVK